MLISEFISKKKKKTLKAFKLKDGGWGQPLQVNDKQRHIQQSSLQKLILCAMTLLQSMTPFSSQNLLFQDF